MQLEKEQIVVIGFGWVGQANALSLSISGYSVAFYDPAEPAFHYNSYGEEYKSIKRIKTPLELDSKSTFYIVCVGDRVNENGDQDVTFIKNALQSLQGASGIVILRSTVRPDILTGLDFDIYLPEFLHEKTAVEECMHPQYFVIGKKDQNVRMPSFFDGWRKRSFKSIECSPVEASHIKYLSNIWNALRIAFVNEFGRSIHAQSNSSDDRAELQKADTVLHFLFEDKPYFHYGRAFGGHCLPKDMRAYKAFSSKHIKPLLFEGILASNAEQELFQQKHHELQEWFSSWRRIDLSGREAFKALVRAIKRKFQKNLK